MKLNFTQSPVSQSAIDKALAERNAEAEKRAALAYTADVTSCQNIVDRGITHLRMLRKQADDFAVEFKKLEGLASPAEFKKVLDTINPSLRRTVFGELFLSFDYDRPITPAAAE